MASPGQFVPEYIVTANDMNALPGGVLGYAERTSDQTGITSEVDLTGLSTTIDVPASRRIRISADVAVDSDTDGAFSVLRIKEGTTTLQERQTRHAGSTDALRRRSYGNSVVVTPSSGSHTYKLTLARGGSGNLTLSAVSTRPSFILVEDLGPA